MGELLAQDSLIFSGQIIDSTTQIPIPFAHIRIEKTVAISNQQGKFTLDCSGYSENTKVIISCIGYKTRKISIANLLKSKHIVLSPDIRLLGEVVISELTPQAIFKNAKKRGYRNYRTPKYSADYKFEQWVFYDYSDSLIAFSEEVGLLINKGLDTTGTYPKYKTLTKKISTHFVEYDTVSHPLSFLTRGRNTVTLDFLLSHDPIRVGVLEEFHAVPAIFSDGFYKNTLQQIQSIVMLDGKEYYLITVYPQLEDSKQISNPTLRLSIEKHKKEVKRLANKYGKTLSESSLDSIFSKSARDNMAPQSYLIGIFLVNTKDFGISHALIKLNTFNSEGRLHSKLHISANYVKTDKSYYLQSLDVLIRREAPFNLERSIPLYYLLSLNLSNIKTKKITRLPTTIPQLETLEKIPPETQALYRMENIRQFIAPVKNCKNCKLNLLQYFNRVF